MIKDKNHKSNKYYETVIVVQSFPVLTYVMNNIENLKKPLCIIVSFNGHISKFMKTVLPDDVDIQCFGYGALLRKTILMPLRKYYINIAHSQTRKISTNKLIMTCNSYCCVSAVFLDAIKFNKVSIWKPYEEKRYSYKPDHKFGLLSYHNYINEITGGLIEGKSFFTKDGKIAGQTVGLNVNHLKLKNANFIAVEQVDHVMPSHLEKFNIGKDYILIVERELLKTGHISLLNYLKILNSLRKLSSKSGLKIYVKFKPRNYYLFKHFIFRAFGIIAMPIWVPAQYYCFNKECKIIFGFTSSALSIDYEKPFYSLASLEKTFKIDLLGNIASMKERVEATSVNMNFVTKLSDVETLEV